MPEDLIQKMAGIGLFGCSVPESYGGTEMGYLTMCVLTEELSTVSLVAGSLITRSEILTRALLRGGTEEQRQHWLPKIASGRAACRRRCHRARCRLRRGVGHLPRHSRRARRPQGLVHRRPQGLVHLRRPRQHPRLAGAHRSDAELGRSWTLAVHRAEGAVRRPPLRAHSARRRHHHGTANPTPGYRGMHSFTLAIDRYFVPEENLVGGARRSGQRLLPPDGRLRGRAPPDRAPARQEWPRPHSRRPATTPPTGGSSGGRSPTTSSRSTRSVEWRTRAAAGRHLTYAAARAMERDEQERASNRAQDQARIGHAGRRDVQAVCLATSPSGSARKRSSSTAAGATPRKTRSPATSWTRLVLPIFEGVKPILELKVIARQLLAGG